MVSATYTHLMQSKYFNPAFNSAIFDGPFRIYFSQSQEPLALKLYFTLQQDYPNEFARAKDSYKTVAKNVLIMVYPTKDAFDMSFETCSTSFALENFGTDVVVGIRGPMDENEIDKILNPVIQEVRTWKPLAPPPSLDLR